MRIVEAEGRISAQAPTSRPARRLPVPAGFEGASMNHGVAESASGHAHSRAGEQVIPRHLWTIPLLIIREVTFVVNFLVHQNEML